VKIIRFIEQKSLKPKELRKTRRIREVKVSEMRTDVEINDSIMRKALVKKLKARRDSKVSWHGVF